MLKQADKREDKQGIGSLVDEVQLSEKLEALQRRRQTGKAALQQVEVHGEKQYSKTDPDARLLAKGGQQIAGYNLQCSVDDKHKLIVTNDVQQLEPIVKRTQEALASDLFTKRNRS